MKEPLWRKVLTWGCVFYFLSIPGLVLTYGILDIPVAHEDRVKFLEHFHLAVSAVIGALAGLNSYDRAVVNGHGSLPKPSKGNKWVSGGKMMSPPMSAPPSDNT